MRQFAHGCLGAFEFGMEPLLQLRHGHMRGMAVVEIGEGQRKFRAKFLQRHLVFARLRQDEVGRLQHRRQIIHERTRPIENDIANHMGILAPIKEKGTK